MATYYLWSPINTEVNEFGRVMKTAKVGEKVTADSLGVDKNAFAELIAVGTVRTEPYPDVDDNVAPAEHFRAMNSEQAELSSSERKELEAYRKAEAEREAQAREVATTGSPTPEAAKRAAEKQK